VAIIFTNLTETEADAYGLVLSSSGISYHVERAQDGWSLYVPGAARTEALKVIEAYLGENKQPGFGKAAPFREYGRTLSGLWVALLVLFFYVAIEMSNDKTALFKTYGSAADPILEGEIYRTLTSLTLHTNAFHLAGNILGIALFGTAVCQLAGPGLGWFMILVSGGVGNYMNALFYRSQHLSVGSSTAVFGAVGILAGYQFLKKLRGLEGPRKSWLPLAGGLALLAFLGAGRHSDVTAHLFGFLAGICIGGIYGLVMKRPAPKVPQACLVFIDLGLVSAAWIIGFVG
jgi:membrane associated rhomboid family serine protease